MSLLFLFFRVLVFRKMFQVFVLPFQTVFKTFFNHEFQLCYALLRYSQVNYPKNQEFLAENFDQIQEQIGYNLTAEDTMTAVLHNNPNLLKKYVKMPHVQRFVSNSIFLNLIIFTSEATKI